MSGLLNYTTSIAASKTITEMMQLLVEAGASAITTAYKDGRTAGLTFHLPTKYGVQTFALPVDVLAVQRVLQKRRPSGHISTAKFHSVEHAERVAWRIAKDWLEAQLALVKIQMATLDQVMLPYLHVNGHQTLYDAYLERQDVLQVTDGGVH